MTTLNQKSSKMNGSLTTEPDSFSDEAWSLLLIAEQSARRWRHKNLDVEHLIEVLFRNKKYQKYTNSLPINHKELNEILENFIAELPINNQPDLFIGEDLEILLEVADDFRSRWGSNQIEISHILIAIGRDNRLGENLFYQAGLPSEILEAELRRLPAPKSFKQSKRNKDKPITNRPQKDSQSFMPTETTAKDPKPEPLPPLSKEEITSKQELHQDRGKQDYLSYFGGAMSWIGGTRPTTPGMLVTVVKMNSGTMLAWPRWPNQCCIRI